MLTHLNKMLGHFIFFYPFYILSSAAGQIRETTKILCTVQVQLLQLLCFECDLCTFF